MPRPPSRTRQLLDPYGCVPDGAHHGRRDPARYRDCAPRPQPAAVRQDRHDQRPDQCLVRWRHARHRRRRLSWLRSPRSLGGYAQGGRISAPIWKQWAQTALKDQPKVPFVAPPGIRWGSIDRARGKPVYGAFPTTEGALAGDLGTVPTQTEDNAAFAARSATRIIAHSARAARPWQPAAIAAATATAAGHPPSGRDCSSPPRLRNQRLACQLKTLSNRAGDRPFLKRA